jgi:hypothetical protein
LALLGLLDFFLQNVKLFLDVLMVGIVLGEYFVHFLAVGVLLCGLDSFGVLGLDGLDSVVIVFEGGDHLPH